MRRPLPGPSVPVPKDDPLPLSTGFHFFREGLKGKICLNVGKAPASIHSLEAGCVDLRFRGHDSVKAQAHHSSHPP